MQTLIAQTVRISHREKGNIITRTVLIKNEFIEEGARFYEVEDLETKRVFTAKAEIYDALFCIKRKKILAKETKDIIHNKSNPDYKK